MGGRASGGGWRCERGWEGMREDGVRVVERSERGEKWGMGRGGGGEGGGEKVGVGGMGAERGDRGGEVVGSGRG